MWRVCLLFDPRRALVALFAFLFVLALLIHFLFPQWETPLLWVFLLLFIVLGIWAANVIVRREGIKDPSKVVADEIAGQFVTLLFVPVSLASVAIGFFVFDSFSHSPSKKQPIQNLAPYRRTMGASA